MEQLIKENTAKALGLEPEQVTVQRRLMGGMSNLMFVMDAAGETLTFRIPGKKGEVFVDRDEELENIKIVDVLGINNETLWFDPVSGYKIARYVEGTPLSETPKPEAHLNDVAEVLTLLHGCSLKAAKEYDPFGRLERYEGLVKDQGFSHDPEYFRLKDQFLSQRGFLEQFPKTFCHNDSQISNIVISDEGQTYLLDWEFGGQNDPLYDCACVGNQDFSLAVKFLPIYLGREPRPEEWKRMYLWRAFQCLQWHNVALYKDLAGLSQELGVDFKVIAAAYLTKAAGFLKEAEAFVII